MEHLSGVITPKPQLKVSAKVKTFVLDTNVLLHDPQSLFTFEENNLVIPVEVLEELDAIKSEQSTERGRNARRVHRHLQELLPDSRTMLEGVKLPNGGTLSVVINRYIAENTLNSPAMQRAGRPARLFQEGQSHHRLRALRPGNLSAPDHPRDQGRQCAAQGPRGRPRGAQDYLNDKVPEPTDEDAYGGD